MKKLYVIAASLLVLPAISAFAANPNPAFKQRHQNFEAMGKAMKGIFDEFKKPAASLAKIKANSAVLAQSAKKVGGHFPKGTGPGAGSASHPIEEPPAGSPTAACLAAVCTSRVIAPPVSAVPAMSRTRLVRLDSVPGYGVLIWDLSSGSATWLDQTTKASG